MGMRGRSGLRCVMLALLAMLVMPLAANAQQKVLRVVPQGEVKIFDPHQSQVNLTSMHAGLVYDTLFSWDADMVPRPQMVESWTVSDDKLLYTFTLRPGLKFSDGSAVTTRDVVATLKRLFLRDSQIQALAQRVAALEAVDDRIFTLRLKEPFRFVEFLLGGSNGIAGGIMREKEAMTDPFTPITEIVGSGPFRFVKDEYRPAAKIVYEKNPYYVPRNEPPSGFAGGKVAKVDRIEFIIIPDAAVAVSALRGGEVDFIDSVSLDVLPTVANDPNIVVGEVWPIETQVVLRPNSIQPPFNNVKARLALAYMSDQREYMTAAYGDPKYWRECYAYWICGSPNGTESGFGEFPPPRSREGEAADDRERLQGREGRGDRRRRCPGLQQSDAGDRRSPEEDRHQCRPADVGLGQRLGAPRQEGSARSRRLEPLPHQRQRRAALEPARQPVDDHDLRRQELRRLAVRRAGGGSAPAIYPRDRSREAEGAGRGDASPPLGGGALRAAGSAEAALPVAQERHGRAQGEHARLLEHREELTAMTIELVTLTTQDGVELDGAMYRPAASSPKPATSVLMVHGLTWNFYRGPSRWLPPLLAARGDPVPLAQHA